MSLGDGVVVDHDVGVCHASDGEPGIFGLAILLGRPTDGNKSNGRVTIAIAIQGEDGGDVSHGSVPPLHGWREKLPVSDFCGNEDRVGGRQQKIVTLQTNSHRHEVVDLQPS